MALVSAECDGFFPFLSHALGTKSVIRQRSRFRRREQRCNVHVIADCCRCWRYSARAQRMRSSGIVAAQAMDDFGAIAPAGSLRQRCAPYRPTRAGFRVQTDSLILRERFSDTTATRRRPDRSTRYATSLEMCLSDLAHLISEHCVFVAYATIER